MSTAELKSDIINRIQNLKDSYIIDEIKQLLDFELDNSVFQLSSAQKQRLIEAEFDNVLSEEQANNDIEKWLNEK
ncbi:hypothetical protein [Chryseobacterium oryzae]|uniref:Addiction module component n=1 Tax=Chryseobacterium oryzae TaxID=2929799 RepID=A0ABY4BI92_9FLAO|nr:hypothetical protein [Chryseobacterium oryzae]UOE38901.1 hypothetical protein MTP08_03770 [Chryseobacterium oryzae]